MSKINQGNLWSGIGKLGVLLTVIWIIIQMISHFSKVDEINIEINGNHYPYSISSNHMDLINDYKKVLSLDKAYSDNVDKNGLSIQKLYEFEKSNGAARNWKFKSDLKTYLSYKPLVKFEKFNEVWRFNIVNIGNAPAEDLLIDLPFNGFYKANPQKGKATNGNFTNRISLGNLAPGYSINVIVWVENIHTSMPEYIEDKTRITHKYGWKNIEYPVKAKGIIAWIIKNNSFPLGIFIILLITLMFIIFMLGINYGPKIQEMEKRRKLKELEELEQLRKEKE